MDGSHYHHPSGTSRLNRFQYQQPHFVQPPRFITPHNSYPATHSAYDVIEDDSPYDHEMQYDHFDQHLLGQYDDHQHTAERDRNRLTLPPGPSRFLSRMRGGETDRSGASGIYVGGEQDQATAHPRLSQFTYNSEQFLGPSSDAQPVVSSSPAFKALHRQAEHQRFDHSHRMARPIHAQTPEPADVYNIGESPIFDSPPQVGRPFQKLNPPRPPQRQITNGTPIVQGIPLVPTSSLSDRLRTIFPFPNFNAVQSKCFDKVYGSDDNFVLSSPTGSGKTAILELAICRAISTNSTSQYKVVYQAPTKALCSERQRDWEKKFGTVGLQCAELTGDTNAQDLKNVQSANIIITTPEKWDSMTRKWKDHERLMKLVKLFLIDEVHILKDDRGAVLEAVVSRMKSIGNGVRFVALSATVPNFQDVAEWLGRSGADPQTPAANEKFGEEFRPVQLKKHVCGYAYHSSNDFGFEKLLSAQLPEVVAKYSEQKPIMVFCATRNGTIATAKSLADSWIKSPNRDRLWAAPKSTVNTSHKELRVLAASGVAFHHGGMDVNDRMLVEKGFLEGNINVICCTSTLAVGVNLPCHLVIIKNTMSWSQSGLVEYSDLEMMQMLGRAGRPQFDDSAVAVIMTRQAKASRYENLVTGQDLLESKLHLNLIDHLNAEISLGTIRDLLSARKWITSTFLYTRLKKNSAYYKLEGSRSGQSLEEQVDDICFRDIALLREYEMVTDGETFQCSEYGNAMTRYYIPFETMKVFIGLPRKATLSEILSAVAQASEFSSIRFRQGEKALYKALNKSPQIRFQIPVNLDLAAHKVSLIIQSVLGSADMSWDGDMAKHKHQYALEVQMIFKPIKNMMNCIIDCQAFAGDSVTMSAALMLERSLGSKAWDDSPLQMIQVPNIGIVAARKLVNARIRSIEDLEAADPHRIETLVGRNPPFGLKILEELKSFPKLHVSIQMQPSSAMKFQDSVKIQLKADIGFMNERTPERFAGKLIYVTVLVETSDGRVVHFARTQGSKIGTGQSVTFPAQLRSPSESINCYVMCNGIAGSMRCASMKPKVSPALFPTSFPKKADREVAYQSNISKRRTESLEVQRKQPVSRDEYGDNEIDDSELMNVTLDEQDFENIDDYASLSETNIQINSSKVKSRKDKGQAHPANVTTDDQDNGPVQLGNGKWACNHKCKDKTACKHLCCHDGVEKPPKKPAKKNQQKESPQLAPQISAQKSKAQTKLQLTAQKRKNPEPVEEIDLTHPEKKNKPGPRSGNPEFHRLEQLHNSVQKNQQANSLLSKKPSQPSTRSPLLPSFLQPPSHVRPSTPSDYGDIYPDEFPPSPAPRVASPSYSDNLPDFAAAMDLEYEASAPIVPVSAPVTSPVSRKKSDTFSNDSQLGDAMMGLADAEEEMDMEAEIDFTELNDDDFPLDVDWTVSAPPPHALEDARNETKQKQRDFKSAKNLIPLSPTQRKPPCIDNAVPNYQPLIEVEAEKEVTHLDPARNMVNKTAITMNPEHKNEQDIFTLDDDLLDILDLDGVESVPPMQKGSITSTPIQTVDYRSPVATTTTTPAVVSEVNHDDHARDTDDEQDLQPWLMAEFGDIVELDEGE